VFVSVAAILAPPVLAQKDQTVSRGVSAQIPAAKKVFIVNTGSECSPPSQVGISGGPDVAYDEFYAGVKEWSELTIVNAPADADLVLEIQPCHKQSGNRREAPHTAGIIIWR